MNTVTLDRIRANPLLHPDALSDAELRNFRWHDYAHSTHSSQVFCVSAFGPIRRFQSKNRIITEILTPVFPIVRTAARPRRWSIELEYEQPELLSEYGSRQTTSIDALLLSSAEVVCVEAKFRSDARSGFGTCGQFNARCRGFYGPGSDEAGTDAWCRLESWDGSRSPRTYWATGKEFFRPGVFERQNRGETCPFRGPNYQLMRNFLFAASIAKTRGLRFFGVLVIVPKDEAGVVIEQIREFKRDVLQDKFHARVGYTTYEEHVRHLKATQDADAVQLAGFLEERLLALRD